MYCAVKPFIPGHIPDYRRGGHSKPNNIRLSQRVLVVVGCLPQSSWFQLGPRTAPTAPTASSQSASSPVTATWSFQRSIGVKCASSEVQLKRWHVSWFCVLHRGHTSDGWFCEGRFWEKVICLFVQRILGPPGRKLQKNQTSVVILVI